MPNAAKRFSPQRPRTTTLSDNPDTIRVRELDQSRVGFAAEDHRIKTKFRTRLARARQALRVSAEYNYASEDDRERMEARCTKMLEDAKLKELESVVAAWLTIVERNDAIQLESDVEGDNGDNDEENDDQMFEDDEWMAFKMIWRQTKMMKITLTTVLRGGKRKVMIEQRRKRRKRRKKRKKRRRAMMSLKKMILTCL